MKSTAVLAGGFLLLATAGAGYAQVNGSGISITGGATPAVNSNSSVSGTTSSTSSSDPTLIVRPKARASARGGTAGAVGNQVQIVQGSSGGGGNAADPYVGTTTQNYSGSYTQTLRNVPELVAPSVNGGANGCAVGVSGGVAVAGFGITTGAGWSDPDCERRQLAALTYNMNEHDLAQEILCDSKEVRAARLRMGKPCLADIAKAGAAIAATETQRVDPAILRRQQDSLASQQPVAAPGPTISASIIHNGKPDWCETASPQELRAHHECD